MHKGHTWFHSVMKTKLRALYMLSPLPTELHLLSHVFNLLATPPEGRLWDAAWGVRWYSILLLSIHLKEDLWRLWGLLEIHKQPSCKDRQPCGQRKDAWLCLCVCHMLPSVKAGCMAGTLSSELQGSVSWNTKKTSGEEPGLWR